MEVSKKITIDLNRPRKETVHLGQGDNQHQIILTLLKDGMPFDVSEGIGTATLVAGVHYIKANGIGGYYDWTSTDLAAVALATGTTNVWNVLIDEHATDVAGFAEIFVKFSLASGETLYSFPITLNVIRTSGGTTDPDKPYYHSTSFLLAGAQAAKTSAMTAPIGVDANGKLWGEAGGWSDEAKQLLIVILRNGLYSSDQSSNISALESALDSEVTLESITADYEQDRPIYDTDDLDAIKSGDDLTVTANYSDGSSIALNDDAYTLSGTLTAGTSTITISYGGKTTTISVSVTHQIAGWYYPFNGSLLSAGTEDFGLTGEGVYDDGFDARQAYKHISPDGTTDEQMGLKAVNVTKMPNLGGDFTLAFWCKTKAGENNGKPIFMTHWESGTQPSTKYFTSPTSVATGWTVTQPDYSGRGLSGVGVQLYSGNIIFRIHTQDLSASAQLTATPPSGFAWDSWHHYAFTRKGDIVRIFVDGVLIGYATARYNTARNSGQVALSAYFYQTKAQASELQANVKGEYMQDLYIAEFCKWESAFDPSAIEY